MSEDARTNAVQDLQAVLGTGPLVFDITGGTLTVHGASWVDGEAVCDVQRQVYVLTGLLAAVYDRICTDCANKGETND